MCHPLNLSTTPSLGTVSRHCACGEVLTLECEFDENLCVDCQADRAKTPIRKEIA